MAYTHSFEIGTTYGGMVNIESLTTVPNMAVRSKFLPYQEAAQMGSGVVVARGSPAAIWEWGEIYTAQFNSLRTLCPGGSAAMYIRTLKDDYSTYAYYTGIMIWPPLDSYERNAKGYQPFSLTFTHLVSYTPST
jgi:hypothetical protein